MTFRGKRGKIYNLSTRIAGGGEGDVYNVINEPYLVAKIYKDGKIESDLERKISLMVKFPPDDEEVLEQIAWPMDALYCPDKKFAGFIMYKIDANVTLEEVWEAGNYKNHDNLTWECKIRIAMNLCAVLDSVHAAGHVIGDFNPKNILVNPGNGLVMLIDTDSYHIESTEKTYRCSVAMPEYVPNEVRKKLDGKYNYSNAPLPTFTFESDYFALAIHIFKLLMNGVHPYSLALSSTEESMSLPGIEKNIANNNYIFGKKIAGFRPSPIAPDFDILPINIKELFQKAFIKGHKNPAERPTPEDWHTALKDLKDNKLKKCKTDPHHVYNKGMRFCPWCKSESVLLPETTQNPNLEQEAYDAPKSRLGATKYTTDSDFVIYFRTFFSILYYIIKIAVKLVLLPVIVFMVISSPLFLVVKPIVGKILMVLMVPVSVGIIYGWFTFFTRDYFINASLVAEGSPIEAVVRFLPGETPEMLNLFLAVGTTAIYVALLIMIGFLIYAPSLWTKGVKKIKSFIFTDWSRPAILSGKK